MLTLQFIKENFHKYNNKYFEGTLKEPTFKITSTRRRLGCCKWRTNYYNERVFTIEISNFYKRSEKDYCQTLIHEMIHLYIRQNDIADNGKHHGPVFYHWANKINRDGWTISRTDSTEGCDCNVEGKEYQVCIYHNVKKDYYFEFVLSPQKVEYYFDLFYYGRLPNIDGYYFFKSKDMKRYSRYNVCRSAIRGYYITKEEYERMRAEYDSSFQTLKAV